MKPKFEIGQTVWIFHGYRLLDKFEITDVRLMKIVDSEDNFDNVFCYKLHNNDNWEIEATEDKLFLIKKEAIEYELNYLKNLPEAEIKSST